MESTILERGPYRYVEEGEGTPLVLLLLFVLVL